MSKLGPFNTSARQFVERIARLRRLGLGLGFFNAGGVFYVHGAHPAVWVVLALYCFAWPSLARWIALRAPSPRVTEYRNLVIDAGAGGFWIAMMGFDLLPSMVTATMLAFNNLTSGGVKFFSRTLLVQIACCAATAALLGFPVHTESNTFEIVAALPLMSIYPLFVGNAMFQLARKVAQQNRKLAEMTRIDALTGLRNRDAWEIDAMAELQRSQRGIAPAALLMIDIDHLKAINQRHGHPAGDDTIRGVAAILGRCIRDVDLLGRYGSDEFALVLVNTDAAEARRQAERIRLLILAGDPALMPPSTVSVSIGIAASTSDMNDIRAWVKQADQALMDAKKNGRDCAMLAA